MISLISIVSSTPCPSLLASSHHPGARWVLPFLDFAVADDFRPSVFDSKSSPLQWETMTVVFVAQSSEIAGTIFVEVERQQGSPAFRSLPIPDASPRHHLLAPSSHVCMKRLIVDRLRRYTSPPRRTAVFNMLVVRALPEEVMNTAAGLDKTW